MKFISNLKINEMLENCKRFSILFLLYLTTQLMECFDSTVLLTQLLGFSSCNRIRDIFQHLEKL